MGLIRDARSAGYVPNTRPTASALATAMAIVTQENPAWKNGALARARIIAVTPNDAARPTITPMALPAPEIATDSVRN